MLPLSGQLLNYKSHSEKLGSQIIERLEILERETSWAFFGETLDLLTYCEKTHKFYSGQNYFVRKQTVEKLCDKITRKP